MRKFRNAVLIVFPLTFVPACFGSTNSCLITGANSVNVAGQQTTGFKIAAAGGATPDDFASLTTTPVTGCNTVDLVFSSFTATVGGVSSNAGTYISTLANQSLTNGAEDAVFSNVRGTDSVLTNADPNDGLNQWAGPGKGAAFAVNTDYEVTSSGLGIQYFTLNLEGLGIGNGGGAFTGTVNLCLGGAWSAGGTGSTCVGGTAFPTINLAGALTTYSANLLTTYTTIGVRNSFTLSPGNGTNSATFLTAFDEDFADFQGTPEPTSIALLSVSLAALAAIGLRRRKRA